MVQERAITRHILNASKLLAALLGAGMGEACMITPSVQESVVPEISAQKKEENRKGIFTAQWRQEDLSRLKKLLGIENITDGQLSYALAQKIQDANCTGEDKAYAVIAAGHTKDESLIPVLTSLLDPGQMSDATRSSQITAIFPSVAGALAEIAEAHPEETVAAVMQRVDREDRGMMNYNLIDILHKMGDNITPTLCNYAMDENESVRTVAVDTFRWRGIDASVRGFLVDRFFDEPSGRIRGRILDELRREGQLSGEEMSRLVNQYPYETDAWARQTYLQLFSQATSDASLDVLVSEASSSNNTVVSTAISALGRRKDARAVATLVRLFTEGNGSAVASGNAREIDALFALGDTGLPEFFPVLVREHQKILEDSERYSLHDNVLCAVVATRHPHAVMYVQQFIAGLGKFSKYSLLYSIQEHGDRAYLPILEDVLRGELGEQDAIRIVETIKKIAGDDSELFSILECAFAGRDDVESKELFITLTSMLETPEVDAALVRLGRERQELRESVAYGILARNDEAYFSEIRDWFGDMLPERLYDMIIDSNVNDVQLVVEASAYFQKQRCGIEVDVANVLANAHLVPAHEDFYPIDTYLLAHVPPREIERAVTQREQYVQEIAQRIRSVAHTKSTANGMGYSEDFEVYSKNIRALDLVRIKVLLDQLSSPEFPAHLWEWVERDIPDKTREYGGVLNMNQGALVMENLSLPGANTNPKFDNLGLWRQLYCFSPVHLHAVLDTYDQSRWAGPSGSMSMWGGDLFMASQRISPIDVVVTPIGNKTINVDIFSGGVGVRQGWVVDLGNYAAE